MIFKNRREAGEKLALKLAAMNDADVAVYALPKGGVVVGAEVAKKLGVPLEVAIVKKIGSPFNPEYAICAISEGGDIACNEAEKQAYGEDWFRYAIERAKNGIDEDIQQYRISNKTVSFQNKTIILTDDGIATGLTMRAAIRWAKKAGAKKIIVAVPVIPNDVAEILETEVDQLVSVESPKNFLGAVGSYYEDFEQLTAHDVVEILSEFTNE